MNKIDIGIVKFYPQFTKILLWFVVDNLIIFFFIAKKKTTNYHTCYRKSKLYGQDNFENPDFHFAKLWIDMQFDDKSFECEHIGMGKKMCEEKLENVVKDLRNKLLSLKLGPVVSLGLCRQNNFVSDFSISDRIQSGSLLFRSYFES